MKAVVLEVNDKESAVLREDGTFETISGIYTVGETIELPEADSLEPIPFAKRNAKVLKWIISAAAVVILAAAMFGIYSYQNLMVYASVRVEGNVALEYDLNRKGNVIAVHALNEAGEEVAEELSEQGIRNISLEEALERVSVIIEDKNIVSEDTAPEIHVHVAGDNEEQIAEFEDVLNNFYGMPSVQTQNNENTGNVQEPADITESNAHGSETMQQDSGFTQPDSNVLQSDSDISPEGNNASQPDQENIEPGSDSVRPVQDNSQSGPDSSSADQPQQNGNNNPDPNRNTQP